MAHNYQVRPAVVSDKQEIANLMFFERHVHRHLDWKHPTDWLGDPFYWVLERNNRIMAVLACPQEKIGVTWLRLFTHKESFSAKEAWEILWESAKENCKKKGEITVSAITIQTWMQNLLKESGFVQKEQVLMMSWEGEAVSEVSLPTGIRIRKMRETDLPDVAAVDEKAFALIWQNPLSMQKQVYARALLPTVAESAEGIVGYQISTKSPFGAHLARLAVCPQVQGRGIASALIANLTTELLAKNISQISVSTHSKNERSIALYTKNGFKHTEEEYPLYSFRIGDD